MHSRYNSFISRRSVLLTVYIGHRDLLRSLNLTHRIYFNCQCTTHLKITFTTLAVKTFNEANSVTGSKSLRIGGGDQITMTIGIFVSLACRKSLRMSI